jgi:adenylate cyclase
MAKSEEGISEDGAGAPESLRAAIEHMEEGFALYDAEDRLVICNSRYLSAFMPDLEGDFVSGMSFEEIVTIAAERDFFAREGRTVEEIVKERMDLRHNPKQPCEMRLANGDWISYREHRTSEGGTVVLPENHMLLNDIESANAVVM